MVGGPGFKVVVGAVHRRLRLPGTILARSAASAAIGVALSIFSVLGAAPVTLSAARYPVPWSFLPSAALAAATNGPDVPPPGANIPCTLSAEHPDPVILVHGLAANEDDNWQTLSPFLADNGYCVYAFTYGNDASLPKPFDEIGGLSPMEQSAEVLATFVNSVLSDTHAAKVDIVGHSEGGTMPDYYLKFLGGSQKVAHFVSISGLLHGDTFWGLSDLYDLAAAYGFGSQADELIDPLCDSCTEFLTGSSFMEQLDLPNAVATATEAATCPYDGAAVDGVSYTSLATNDDELVRPPTSDFIDPRCNGVDEIGIDNILVQDQCPLDQADHLSIASDPVAAQDILNALDPADEHPVPCTLVLPSVG